jgi:hypothetical protein
LSTTEQIKISKPLTILLGTGKLFARFSSSTHLKSIKLHSKKIKIINKNWFPNQIWVRVVEDHAVRDEKHSQMDPGSVQQSRHHRHRKRIQR